MVRAGKTQQAEGRGPERPLAFWLHSLLGLKLCVIMLFVCFTGTLATVSDEIEWLLLPRMRATPTAHISWQAQLEAAQQAFPAYRYTYMAAGEGRYLATRLEAEMDGHLRVVTVDPGRNVVTGESGFAGFRSAIRALHYTLFVSHDAVFYAITSLGFVLLVSAVSGLVVYRKFWRGFFRMPRWRKDARLVLGDLHRLAGLWLLPFLFIIAFTSLWYMAERMLSRAGIDWERSVMATVAPQAEMLSLDELAARAQAALPGFRATAFLLPRQPGDALVIQGQTTAWLARDRANQVVLDPYGGAVLALRPAGAMPAQERWLHAADPLHFGDFAGLPSKLLWTVFGLMLSGLSLSGAVIHVKRMGRHVPFSTRTALDCLGAWKWPSLAAVTLLPAIAFFADWLPSF